MKKIYILGLSLISLIVLHLVINVIKNLLDNLDKTEGFNSKCTVLSKANRCQYSTIESTRLRTLERANKIKELENIVAKTKAQVLKNNKDISDSLKASKQLQNVANNKDEDTSDACKQYPEAC